MNETDRIRDVLVKLNRSLLRKFPAKGFYYSYESDGDYHHGIGSDKEEERARQTAEAAQKQVKPASF